LSRVWRHRPGNMRRQRPKTKARLSAIGLPVLLVYDFELAEDARASTNVAADLFSFFPGHPSFRRRMPTQQRRTRPKWTKMRWFGRPYFDVVWGNRIGCCPELSTRFLHLNPLPFPRSLKAVALSPCALTKLDGEGGAVWSLKT
jgi:hypothetical protein